MILVVVVKNGNVLQIVTDEKNERNATLVYDMENYSIKEVSHSDEPDVAKDILDSYLGIRKLTKHFR